MEYRTGEELFLADKNGNVVLRVVPHMAARTNADRIRAMNDEEMAEFAVLSTKYFCTKKYEEVCEKPMGCKECALDWLSQPTKGD